MRYLYSFLIAVSFGISSSYSQTFEDSIVVSETSILADSLKFYDFISPNGDGHNDYFIIDYLEYFPNSYLMIYNVWGNLVFEDKNYHNNFAGKANAGIVPIGQNLPEGVYYYTLFDTIKRKHSGKFTLKR